MLRAALFISGLKGWRRHGAALLAGALCVLALAPFSFWYVLLAAIPVLVWLIDGCCLAEPSVRQRAVASAYVGWWFGLGYFVAGLSWVGRSFLVEAGIFAWLLPLAVLGLPAGLALFFAAGSALAGAFWRPGLARILGLTFGLSAAEIARGSILTGLPWNTLGYAFTATDAMMQWASVFGVYGLTFLVVAVGAVPAAVLQPFDRSPRGHTAGVFYALIMMSILGGGWAWGEHRLSGAVHGVTPDVRLRIVQPNIPQVEKWVPENRVEVFRAHLEVSRNGPAAVPEGLERITHLIWPESALPFLLESTPEALAAIDALLPEGTTLLTGQARGEPVEDGSAGGNDLRIFNSLFVMSEKAQVLARYDKVHLVPFGEYLPFQEVLESLGLQQLTRVRGGFAPGRNPRFLDPPGAPPFVPLICYEVIFPHQIRADGTQPQWLLNVTNDAWFGVTLGPYQHFHQARVRAVEEGLPLVRAANTGISAVVDAYGRIVGKLPLGARDALDTELPVAGPPTLFATYGRILDLGLAALFLLSWLYLIRGRPFKKGHA